MPLLIHFPGDRYAGVISANTQIIDVAPTILDYLDSDIPPWLEGGSLLSDPEPDRLIVNVSVVGVAVDSIGRGVIPDEQVKPPFYQFGKLNVIQCQNWFSYNLRTLEVTMGEVQAYDDPYPEDQLDSEQVIREKVGRMWTEHDYVLPDTWSSSP